MLKGSCENMTQLDLAGGDSKQKKKSAALAAKRRADGSRKRRADGSRKRRANGPPKPGTPPEESVAQVEPPLPPSVSRLERTRRLILAALRVWELRWHIRD